MFKIRVSANDPGLLAMRNYAEIQCERELILTTTVLTNPGSRKPSLEQQESKPNRTTAHAIRQMRIKMLRSSS